MLARVHSAACQGVDAVAVEVEVDVSGGLPAVVTVGLPDSAVKESRDRVKSALTNSGYRFPPKRITINLAPADIKKEGSLYDLPIAIGLLAASEQLESGILAECAILGELALDGRVRAVRPRRRSPRESTSAPSGESRTRWGSSRARRP